jgi:hypothetical protein
MDATDLAMDLRGLAMHGIPLVPPAFESFSSLRTASSNSLRRSLQISQRQFTPSLNPRRYISYGRSL